MPAGILCVFAALIITTPLCNFIFSCGCTWPGLGLDSHCNFHVEQVPDKCPWCVSWIAAGFSLGSALLVGYCLSVFGFLNTKFEHFSFYPQVLLRFCLGLTAFIGVAFFGGLISAILLDYPLT